MSHRARNSPRLIVGAVPSDGGHAGSDPVGSIAVFGPGLIGGSIALALRTRCPGTRVTIWGRSQDKLADILRQGVADAVHTDPATAVKEADLVVLCTPVGVMKDLAEAISPYLRPEAVVSDAGSVKECVVAKLAPVLGGRFVGAHPMAGSECSGMAAARADLFAGAACILTPLPSTAPAALRKVTAFWMSLGTHIASMSPHEHDRLVSRLSHLPHALAFALADLVGSTLPEGSARLAGGSFRDATRVATSDPRLWTDILVENRTEIVAALRDMSDRLGALASDLQEEKSASILDFLTRGKEHCRHLTRGNT